MPDTLIGERRYNVVTHIRRERRPVMDKETGKPVMEWKRSGSFGQAKARVKTKLVSVTTTQLESYERQARKRRARLNGVSMKRLRKVEKRLAHHRPLGLPWAVEMDG